MADEALRAAERALRANPNDRGLAIAYTRAWQRAGCPGRDPRVNPVEGDVVQHDQRLGDSCPARLVLSVEGPWVHYRSVAITLDVLPDQRKRIGLGEWARWHTNARVLRRALSDGPERASPAAQERQ